MAQTILQTQHYRLREVDLRDSQAVLDLVSDAEWLRFIGDRGVVDTSSAQAYITDKIIPCYAKFSFGLWAITTLDNDVMLGLCGFLLRGNLAFPDLGYAICPEHRGKRILAEVAPAALAWLTATGERFVYATTTPDHTISQRILADLGFVYAMPHFDGGVELSLFRLALDNQ
jgi:RimJ/RimL family protein N-acetyltransferase